MTDFMAPSSTWSSHPDSDVMFAVWRMLRVDAVVAHTGDPAFRLALGEAVKVVRPLAVDVARALDGADSSEVIGVVIGREKREALVAADSLATDLLASALLLDSFAGAAAARVAVDFLRRRRALSAIDWKAIDTLKGSCDDAGRPWRPTAMAAQP